MASHLRLLAQIVRVRKGSTFCMLMLLPLQKCSKQTQWMRFSSVTTLFSHGFYEHFRSFGCLGKATPPKSPKQVHCALSSAILLDEDARRQQVSSQLVLQITFHHQVVNMQDIVGLTVVGASKHSALGT